MSDDRLTRTTGQLQGYMLSSTVAFQVPIMYRPSHIYVRDERVQQIEKIGREKKKEKKCKSEIVVCKYNIVVVNFIYIFLSLFHSLFSLFSLSSSDIRIILYTYRQAYVYMSVYNSCALNYTTEDVCLINAAVALSTC